MSKIFYLLKLNIENQPKKNLQLKALNLSFSGLKSVKGYILPYLLQIAINIGYK